MKEHASWKSRLSDTLFNIGVVLFILLTLLLPFFVVRDVLANNRVTLGFPETNKLPFFVELIHTAYFFYAIGCILIFFAVAVPALRKQEEKVDSRQYKSPRRLMGLTGCSILSLLYVGPLVWLLLSVPGYWKLALDIVLDWITG
jgi:small-conductance mechanosensitive channel